MKLTHIDTCLGCYLIDHCNGEHEALLGVPVDNETLWGDQRGRLAQDLCTEFNMLDTDGKPDFPKDEAFIAALADFLATVDPAAQVAPDVEPVIADDAGDYCQAWFRLSWKGGEPDA